MSKRILIVDDEPRYLRLLEANLKTEGYNVVTAADGVQAIEAFSSHPADLVLLDIMMPPRRLRHLPAHPPVLERADHHADRQRRRAGSRQRPGPWSG